jgi:hypothetical protein
MAYLINALELLNGATTMQHNLRKHGDDILATQRFNADYAARPLAYLSHGARFERMIQRYQVARAEGRTQAAAAIKRAASRIVDEMPR